MKIFFSFLVVLLLVSGLVSAQTLDDSIKQGLLGTIVVREGNLMPTPKRVKPKRDKKSQAPSREMLVYELTNLTQAKANGSFFAEVQTKPVAKVTVGADGIFQIYLKPGRYSLFSQEPEGLFANQFDGHGNIFPVEVVTDRLTLVEFVVDYNASY